MKKPIILCILIFMALSVFSQTKCKDIIYTMNDGRILFDCCIEEVVNGNIVIYLKNGNRDSVAATAITRKREYIELIVQHQPATDQQQQFVKNPNYYKGHAYEFYESRYKQGKTIKGFGMFSLFMGIGFGVAGIATMASHANELNDTNGGGAVLFGLGLIFFNVGMPFLIAGSAVKANNRKVMNIIQDQRALSLGFNNYGFGLAYHF